MIDHYQASALVRYWQPKSMANPFSVSLDDELENVSYTYPGEGYLIRVTFTKLKGYPDKMRVRSTNWRCEHEPNGVVNLTECRAFAKKLLRAGFVQDISPDPKAAPAPAEEGISQ